MSVSCLFWLPLEEGSKKHLGSLPLDFIWPTTIFTLAPTSHLVL